MSEPNEEYKKFVTTQALMAFKIFLLDAEVEVHRDFLLALMLKAGQAKDASEVNAIPKLIAHCADRKLAEMADIFPAQASAFFTLLDQWKKEHKI